MSKILIHDETVIGVAHIVTANRAVDEAKYRKASMSFFLAEAKIRDAGGNPELQEALEKEKDAHFPKGRPEIKDYWKTRLCLSDGQILFVDYDLKYVLGLMEKESR